MVSEAPYAHDPAWPDVRLGDLTTKIGSGATPRGGSESYLPTRETYAFVRSQNVFDRRFDASALAFISDEQANGLRGVVLQPGDVLLNITGDGVTFGRAALVDEAALPACVNQHVSIVRADPSKADPRYLLAYLTHPQVKPYIASFNSGGSRRAITKGHIESFRVPLPPLDTQRAIAATLGALDDKIESNRNTCSLVLELADAKYEAACEDGGWLAPLGQVAEFQNRRRVPLSSQEREQRPGPYPYYGATGVFGYVDDFLFDEMLVLVGEDGSVVNADGTPVTQYIWGKSWINNHAHPLTAKGISNELLLLALRASDVRPIVTGAVQPKISMGNLKKLELRLPNADRVEPVQSELSALFAIYRQRADEEKALLALRNALLPELLSGRIRVPEAAEAVEEAVE